MEQPSWPPHKEHATIQICVQRGRHNEEVHLARQDVCFRRSRWIRDMLRDKNEQEQWLQLVGLHPQTADALVSYLQINSTPIRALRQEDRQMLIELFQLDELQQEEPRNDRGQRDATTEESENEIE